jgi:uncharacterized repeat protein (TIGR03943 family)
MTLDWTRLLRGLGVAAWAGFFDYLWISGHANAYVGPRTTWVVTFGALTLTVVAAVYLAGVRSTQPAQTPRAAEVGRLGIVIAPIVLAAMAPAVGLGAQAVGQKRAAEGKAAIARLKAPRGDIRLYELAAARTNPKWATDNGIVKGLEVRFDGFIFEPAKNGTVVLSRFLATCCAADAVPYSITVTSDVDVPFKRNQWVKVSGVVQTGGKRKLYVAAHSIDAIDRPLNPYG